MKPYYYARRQSGYNVGSGVNNNNNGRGNGYYGKGGYGKPMNNSTTPLPPPSSYIKPGFHSHTHNHSPKNLTESNPPPSEEMKQAVCENSYLGNKGYTIPKSCLSDSEMKTLRKETTLTPKSMGPSFGAPGSQKDPPPCPYYRENEKNLYLPRAYGISRYGLPYETRLSFGRDAREALTFASDKPLRDYQNEIINVYLEHIRTQVQEFEVEVEGAMDNIPTAPLATENKSLNQTHLERVEYGGGGILEVPCGRGKCLAKDTPILMYDGSVKFVQYVCVGDVLMGDDSTPRKVLSLARGREKMYAVSSLDLKRNMYYKVNESHILSLKKRTGEIVDISVLDYLKHKSIAPYDELFGYRVPISFEYTKIYANPYRIGYDYKNYAYLPQEYVCNSPETILQVLAGMIDYDGIYHNGGYEILLKRKHNRLASNILFMARRLGYYAFKKTTHYSSYYDFCCAVFICGYGIHRIPIQCMALKKLCMQDYPHPELLNFSLNVMAIGEDDYYGFEIDGNRRFVLGDFTVTHNTVMALKIISEIGRPALIFVNKGFLADQWLERIATYLPRASVGRIQADKFDIEGRDIVICMIQTIYDRDYTTQAVFRDFGITVIDEVHRIGSGEYSKAMFNITTPYVLGISATVDRKDGMEQALKLFIGDVLYSDKRQDGDCVQIRSVEYSDPKDEKYNEVEHDFRGNVKYATMMSKICEHRPRLDFLFRLLVDLVEEYPEDVSEISGCGILPQKSTVTLENYFLKTGEKKGEEKGAIECLVCHRQVCSEDFIQTSCGHSFCDTCLDDLDTPKCPLCKKRFTLLMTPSLSTMATDSSTAPSSVSGGGAPRLTEYPGQNQIIVLAQYRSVLKELYKRIQSTGLTTVGYYVGGMKQEDLDISKTKQILLATYSMASEGLDVATLSTLVFATPRTDIKQSVGRILRQKHARNPIVVDVVDSHSTFKNQWSKRRAYYKQNGYAIYKITSDQYGTAGMKDVDKTWKLVFSPSSVAKGTKVVGKKGEILEKGGCGNISGERGSEGMDSDEDDSEAIRKMAFDGVCML